MQYSEIYQRIKDRYERGETQKEIADKAGCSHQYISKLLHGELQPGKMSLELLEKLFPGVRVVFSDEYSTDIHHNTNSSIVTGDGKIVNHGNQAEETAKEFLKRVMASSEIDAETKVKLYNMLDDQ